jgi:hypothetical protein
MHLGSENVAVVDVANGQTEHVSNLNDASMISDVKLGDTLCNKRKRATVEENSDCKNASPHVKSKLNAHLNSLYAFATAQYIQDYVQLDNLVGFKNAKCVSSCVLPTVHQLQLSSFALKHHLNGFTKLKTTGLSLLDNLSRTHDLIACVSCKFVKTLPCQCQL